VFEQWRVGKHLDDDPLERFEQLQRFGELGQPERRLRLLVTNATRPRSRR
jgi:hypothetical protein